MSADNKADRGAQATEVVPPAMMGPGGGGPSPPESEPTSVNPSLPSSVPGLPASVPSSASSLQKESTILRFPWIPMIDRFNWCCSLKIWCLIQGWFMAVYGLLMIITIALVLKDHCARFGGCYYYALYQILVALLYDGVAQLFVSGLFLLGINQAHTGLLTPYVVFLHIKIFTDLDHVIYLSSDRGQFPAAVTTFVALIPLCTIVVFLTCANSLRVKMANEASSRNSQIA